MAAAADCRGQRQFTVACGVLSQRVRADAETAKTAAAASPTLLLMPGADISCDTANEELEPSPAQEPAHAQLTIIYGGRVIVLDDVPEDRAKELVLVASAMPQDMLMARKASLRRFMEKRQDRLAARAPYGASRHDFVSASKKGKAVVEESDASSWLGLGIPGESRR